MNPLTRARAFLGFTQAQMADALGMSRATYQRRETLAEDAIPVGEVRASERIVGEWAILKVFGGPLDGASE